MISGARRCRYRATRPEPAEPGELSLLQDLFKGRKGLLHTIYCLKNELLMLGAISLVLTAAQVGAHAHPEAACRSSHRPWAGHTH